MEDYRSISIEELVRLCSSSGDAAAWEEFVRRFHRLIAVVVLRTASRFGVSSVQVVDDLIQETYLKLCGDNCRILRDFNQRHPDAFLGYVRVVTANVVRDHFKSSLAGKRGVNQVQEIGDSFTPMAPIDSAGSPMTIERGVLIKEIQRHLDTCIVGPDQDRKKMIFWLYYRVGLSASAIAVLPGVSLSTKGVESIIQRITGDLRERMVVIRPGPRSKSQNAGEGIFPAESF
jgi:RNA polymerase sigma-70 factor (ECF subfamily)